MRSFIENRPFLIIILLFFGAQGLMAQGDCSALPERSNERLACEYGRKAITFKQGSKQSQILFDSAIALNPKYAWAYYEKSVPFFKRGLLSEGIQLLNKAVDLDPLSYLTYRAYWFYQHKSFAYCRNDLEAFYAMEGSYPENTPGGAMDMRLILAITYVQLGANEKGIELINETINSYPSEDYLGPYDYHALGAAYFKNGQYAEARAVLLESIKRNEQFADSYYYLAAAAEQLGDLKDAKYYINESVLRYNGEKNGYSGYPLCFPIAKQMAVDKMKALEALK